MAQDTRIEKDSMGEMTVPAHALWGASTQRAVENFPVSGYRFGRRFIRALGLIKQSAAIVNGELGVVDKDKTELIAKAAEDVIEGKLDKHFVCDIFQTGSGTSTNMMEGQAKLWGEIKDGILDSNWKAAEKSAWLLAEVSNVNQYQHEAADYKGWAKQMSDQCVELAGVLKKKDAAKSRDLVSKIGNTCSECHNKYK